MSITERSNDFFFLNMFISFSITKNVSISSLYVEIHSEETEQTIDK